MLPPRSRSFEEACSAVDNPATSRGDVVNWGAVVESVFEAEQRLEGSNGKRSEKALR